MGFTERERANLEEGLRRLSEFNDELLMRGLERLGQLGSDLTTAPPDRYWPTTAALMLWHQQQRRAIGATMSALRRMTARMGANGVDRYPTSEWGEPLALVTWMPRSRDRRGPLGMSERERWPEGARGETCPGCRAGPLTITTRARGFGRGQERRTFGFCPHGCKLTIDVTARWDADADTWDAGQIERVGPRRRDADVPRAELVTSVVPPGSVVERRVSESNTKSRSEQAAIESVGTVRVNGGKPYFDEATNEWYRDAGGAVHLLVAGEADLSEAQPAKSRDEECWACGMAPHSRRYHEWKVVEALGELGIRRMEEGGRVRVERVERSARFHDESAQ